MDTHKIQNLFETEKVSERMQMTIFIPSRLLAIEPKDNPINISILLLDSRVVVVVRRRSFHLMRLALGTDCESDTWTHETRVISRH